MCFGLALSGCDMTFEPDLGQRDDASEQVIRAARDGDREELLNIALPEMQEREAAADALMDRVGRLNPSSYSVEYREHHGAPDNYIVTATDAGGNTASFELDWMPNGSLSWGQPAQQNLLLLHPAPKPHRTIVGGSSDQPSPIRRIPAC